MSTYNALLRLFWYEHNSFSEDDKSVNSQKILPPLKQPRDFGGEPLLFFKSNRLNNVSHYFSLKATV